MTNFDNILYSFLAVFQCVTLEGWTHIMIALQKAFSPFVVLYFVPLVFIGAFFLLNLTLAVIKTSFTCIMESEFNRADDETETEYSFDRDEDFQPRLTQTDISYLKQINKSNSLTIGSPDEVIREVDESEEDDILIPSPSPDTVISKLGRKRRVT
jgi:hypothetical protein